MKLSIASVVVAALTFFAGCQQADRVSEESDHGKAEHVVGSTDAISREHEEIHATLEKATQEEGDLGAAAQNLAQQLHPHFDKEEAYVTPLIAALKTFAEGKEIADAEKLIVVGEALRNELPQMLKEHKEIVKGLRKFLSAAQNAGKLEYVHFVQELIRHAKREEQVVYPAALLMGEYLKLKASKGQQPPSEAPAQEK